MLESSEREISPGIWNSESLFEVAFSHLILDFPWCEYSSFVNVSFIENMGFVFKLLVITYMNVVFLL